MRQPGEVNGGGFHLLAHALYDLEKGLRCSCAFFCRKTNPAAKVGKIRETAKNNSGNVWQYQNFFLTLPPETET